MIIIIINLISRHQLHVSMINMLKMKKKRKDELIYIYIQNNIWFIIYLFNIFIY